MTLNVDSDLASFTSLTSLADTPQMNFLTAVSWAEQHDAVLRFNHNPQQRGRSFRVMVHSPRQGERIVAVHQLVGDLQTVMAQAISEVRAQYDTTRQRSLLHLVT